MGLDMKHMKKKILGKSQKEGERDTKREIDREKPRNRQGKLVKDIQRDKYSILYTV